MKKISLVCMVLHSAVYILGMDKHEEMNQGMRDLQCFKAATTCCIINSVKLHDIVTPVQTAIQNKIFIHCGQSVGLCCKKYAPVDCLLTTCGVGCCLLHQKALGTGCLILGCVNRCVVNNPASNSLRLRSPSFHSTDELDTKV